MKVIRIQMSIELSSARGFPSCAWGLLLLLFFCFVLIITANSEAFMIRAGRVSTILNGPSLVYR